MTYNFPAGSGGAESFTELADAPAEIVARKMLRGTADGQDLEFVPAPYAREAVDYVDFNFASPSTDTLDLSNNPPYGLSAGMWTEKGSRILAVANKLRAGVVWSNTFNKFDPTSPFGGYKESGFGREGGRHGLEAYLDV